MAGTNFIAYGGPAYNNENLPPFSFSNIDRSYNNFHQGLPDVWKFSPINFGKDDFLYE
jgi:hypothetical protein